MLLKHNFLGLQCVSEKKKHIDRCLLITLLITKSNI